MPQAPSIFTWPAVVRAVFRFHRRGLAVFAGILVLAVVGLVLCPRKYVSESKVLVRLGRENMALDPTATTGAVVGFQNSRDAEINSVLQVLSCRANIERVLDAIGPVEKVATPADREREVTRLTKNISISSPRNSTVVTLACKDASPERAQHVLKTLLDISLREHVRVNRTLGSFEFFSEQAQALKAELETASAALRDAKNRCEVVTLDGRRAALQQQLSTLELAIQDTAASLAAAEAKIASVEQNLDSIPDSLVRQMIGGTPNNGVAEMRQKLFELQAREQELLSTRSEAHPAVAAIRQQVREAERILATDVPKRQQTATAALTIEHGNAASLKAKAKTLAAQHEQLKEQIKQLNENEVRITELERTVKLLDANFMHYATSREQARIDQALKTEGISNLSVIQEPTFVFKPTSPKSGLTLALAFVLALVGGVGTMLLSEHLDESLRASDDDNYPTRSTYAVLAGANGSHPTRRHPLSNGNGHGHG